MSLYSSEKFEAEEFGEMLFTEYGIRSVILTLGGTASELIQAKSLLSSVDLKPALSHSTIPDCRGSCKFSRKTLRMVWLSSFEKYDSIIIDNADLPLEKPCNQITRERWKLLECSRIGLYLRHKRF